MFERSRLFFLAILLVIASPAAWAQAYVLVERTETTGPESIQAEYAKLARDILPKYGARYRARSQSNVLLEGEGTVPCCLALLEFPSMDAVKRWYESPENQAAAKVRQRGARFRLIAIQGLPPEKQP